MIYLDDGYGRPFGEATEDAIAMLGTDVLATVAFAGQRGFDLCGCHRSVGTTQPEVVAVIADGVTGPAIINAIDAAAQTRLTYVVNDAIRRPAASAQAVQPGLALRVSGVSPVATPDSPTFTQALLNVDPDATGLYAHNVYDCLTSSRWLPRRLGSNQPTDDRRRVTPVTSSGTALRDVRRLHRVLADGRNIDYNGPSGNLSIDVNGNAGQPPTSRVHVRRAAAAMSPMALSSRSANQLAEQQPRRPVSRPTRPCRCRTGRTRRTRPMPRRSASCRRLL